MDPTWRGSVLIYAPDVVNNTLLSSDEVLFVNVGSLEVIVAMAATPV